MTRTRLATMLLAACLPTLATTAHAVEDCEADGKWINLSNGSMTRDLTATVKCVDRDTKQPTREIPYVGGRLHGTEKSFGRASGEGKTVHTEYRDGQRHGTRRTWHRDGWLESEVAFEADREQGLAKYYYPSGKVRAEVERAEANATTLRTEYLEDGRIAALSCGASNRLPIGRGECRYRNETGTVRTYHAGGVVKEVLPFRDGLLHGTVEWHSAAGTRVRTEELVAGRLDGVTRIHRDDGTLEHEARLADGVVQGAYRRYFDTGGPSDELTFENGEIVRERTWYQNGTLRADATRTPEGIEARGWWDNGRVRYTGRFSEPPRRASSPPRGVLVYAPPRLERDANRFNDWGGNRVVWPRLAPQGMHGTFFSSGSPEAQIALRDGRRDGESRWFHDNGQVREHAVYANGTLTSLRQFDRNGALTLDEAYFPDGSRRTR